MFRQSEGGPERHIGPLPSASPSLAVGVLVVFVVELPVCLLSIKFSKDIRQGSLNLPGEGATPGKK